MIVSIMQLDTLRSFVEFAFEFAFASARVLFIHLPGCKGHSKTTDFTATATQNWIKAKGPLIYHLHVTATDAEDFTHQNHVVLRAASVIGATRRGT